MTVMDWGIKFRWWRLLCWTIGHRGIDFTPPDENGHKYCLRCGAVFTGDTP